MFRKLKLKPNEVEQSVAKVTSLRWHGSLNSALTAGKSSGKPVLWIQALGDLDGFL